MYCCYLSTDTRLLSTRLAFQTLGLQFCMDLSTESNGSVDRSLQVLEAWSLSTGDCWLSTGEI
ncbi:hypothetical protein Taro_046273 [Colocasia esculenta]|uniref:Uncharacterized protein n=1 Tax=Colocasia esculenta TaxID=4460 RepID=A0A843X1X5_COLES|nr:hypothetical protein [Colocasia esculenta]